MRTAGKIIIVFFILLAVLLGAAYWWIKTYGPERLVGYLQERVQLSTNGRYQLALDSLGFELLTLSVEMSNLRFERDTTVQELSDNALLDRYDLSVYFNNLEIKYFDLLKYVRKNHLKVKSFQLVDPRVIIHQNPDYHPAPPSPDSMVVDSTALQDLVDTTLTVSPVYEIGEFRLVNAQLEFYEAHRQDPLLKVSGINSTLYSILSTADAPIASSNLDFRVDTVSAFVGKYTAKIDVYGFRASKPQISLDSLRYHHLIGKYEINSFKGFRANWVDIRAGGLKLEGIDYQQMIADSGLVVQKVHLDDLYVYLFKDKSEPRINPAFKPLPPTLVRQIKIPLKIDSIEVAQGEIIVEQQIAGAKKSGALTINRFQALVTNLTNMPEAWEKDPYLVVSAEAFMMDKGPARAAFRFKTDSPDDLFWGSGKAGPMPFEALNPFLATQALVRFKEGQLENLSYDITGNNRTLEGTLDFEYNGLKLAKLEDYQEIVDEDPGGGFLISLINYALPEIHLKERKGYVTGKIYTEKPYNRDIIFYWTEGLASGVISNMGFGPKNPAEAAQRQRDRAARQAERAARRLEIQKEKERKKEERKNNSNND